jgi:hypothetical protein
MKLKKLNIHLLHISHTKHDQHLNGHWTNHPTTTELYTFTKIT